VPIGSARPRDLRAGSRCITGVMATVRGPWAMTSARLASAVVWIDGRQGWQGRRSRSWSFAATLAVSNRCSAVADILCKYHTVHQYNTYKSRPCVSRLRVIRFPSESQRSAPIHPPSSGPVHSSHIPTTTYIVHTLYSDYHMCARPPNAPP